MNEFFNLDDMSASDLKGFLGADIDDLTDDELLAVRDFIRRVGGVKNARLAVQVLEEIERAA